MNDEEIRYPPARPGQVSIGFRGLLAKYGASGRLTQTSEEPRTRGPRLFAFADIVGYSSLSPRLQRVSQSDIADFLSDGITEAGIPAELIIRQDQGDATMMVFPADVDVSGVLAVMPQYLNDALMARNRDMAPHAQMRIRIAFTVGASAPGAAGVAGEGPTSAARLASLSPFRHVMTLAEHAQVGIITDDHVHDRYIRQESRPGIGRGNYVPVHVSYANKDSGEIAWVRLFGYAAGQITPMLAGIGAVVTGDAGRKYMQITLESARYATAALSAYGGAVLSKGQDDAAEDTVRFGRRLLQRIFGRKDDGEPLPSVLAGVIGHPGDPDYLGALRVVIHKALESEPQMLGEIREILDEAESSAKGT